MSANKHRSALTKYLNTYAEVEVKSIPEIGELYDHLLMIPIFDESLASVLSLLKTDFNNERVLFVMVINCPDDAVNEAVESTVTLWHQLLQSDFIKIKHDNSASRSSANQTYLLLPNGHGLLMVDRCSKGQRIPKKQGVGLARKIAADIACRLIDAGTVVSPWIHSTDADVILPADYFDHPYKNGDLPATTTKMPVALLYPFEHVPDAGFEQASALYDWSLRYYVEALQWAGSGYAYHTIGSLITVHYEAYSKVRGFPKRSGGEDFYLLNKLAKVGPIISLDAPLISIAARPSHRVPFGTGPAIKKIVENGNAIDTYLYYHPDIFVQLKVCLAIMVASWKVRDKSSIDSARAIFLAVMSECRDVNSMELAGGVSDEAIAALSSLGFAEAWHHAIAHSKDEAQFIRQVTTWFDGFLTLKFIHALRANHYPSLSLKPLLESVDYLSESLCSRAENLLIGID